jgi:hypothetical protein
VAAAEDESARFGVTLLVSWLSFLVAPVHLAAMGLAGLGPLAAAGLEWYGTRHGQHPAVAVARLLARWSLAAALLGMVLGGVALAALWWSGYRAYFEAWRVIPPRRLWFGGLELLFYLACMGVYVRSWERLPRPVHRLLALLAATNVLWHFPPLFAMVTVISTRAELWGQPLEYGRLLQMLADGETLSRVVHVLLAGVAVVGVTWMHLAARLGGGSDEQRAATQRLAAWGARVGLSATAAQVLSGAVLLMALPGPAQARLLGGDLWATLLLASGAVAIIPLAHALTAAALGDTSRRLVAQCAAWMAVVFLLMFAAGHRQRTLNYGEPPRRAAAARDDAWARATVAARVRPAPSCCQGFEA